MDYSPREKWLAGAFVTLLPIAIGATWQVATGVTKSQIETLQNRIAYLDAENKKTDQSKEQKQILPLSPTNAGPAAKRIVDKQDALDIAFKKPRDGDSVDERVDIEFRVVGRIPDGYRPVVLVMNPQENYWSLGPTNGRINNATIGLKDESGLDFDTDVKI